MKKGLKHRLLHAIGATSLGPISTAVIQLVSVPVFLHFWGPKLYGEWLLLSAIPIYLGLTDFGFGSVAATDMAMQVARGERSAALEVFQSVWVLTTVVSASIGLCAALVLWTLPITAWLHVTLLSSGQVAGILSFLCIYVLFDLQWTVVAAGFRCDGNYALGTILGVAVRFATNLSSIIAVAFHATPLVVAIILAVVRLMGNQTSQIVLMRKSPWLHYGYRRARLSVIRKLFSPAIAYMAFPVGNAFSLQGMTIVVGAVLGPIAVVVFSTVRTLTRFVYQMVDMVTNSIWTELAVAFGANDKALARNIHRCACQASLGLALAGILFLTVLGSAIYGRWTHYRVAMDMNLFYFLLLEVLVNAFWFTSSIVPISCNRHEGQAMLYLITTGCSLPVAYLLMKLVGLSGAGISLLMVDIGMSCYVLNRSLGLLQDNWADFGRALFRAPALGTGTSEPGV